MERKATRFELIGDPTRMQILEQLGGNKKLRAKDLLENLNISQPTLSHHMHILVEEKIVSVIKIGRECFYSIDEVTLREMISELTVLLSDAADSSLKTELSAKSSKDKKEKKDKKKKKKDKKSK